MSEEEKDARLKSENWNRAKSAPHEVEIKFAIIITENGYDLVVERVFRQQGVLTRRPQKIVIEDLSVKDFFRLKSIIDKTIPDSGHG